MSKEVKAVIITVLAGIIGLYLGASINLEGYLGLIFAIAAATVLLSQRLTVINRLSNSNLANKLTSQNE